ncbi:hypothetical protein ABH981_001410 [Bradyrhizobium ottawaense]
MIAPTLAQRSARTLRPLAANQAPEARGSDHAGEQDREPQQPRDLGPVRRHEGEECSRDQQTADDADDHGNVDARRQRRQRITDRGSRRRRNHAIGLPLRKISLEAVAVGLFEHWGEVTLGPHDGGALLGRVVRVVGSSWHRFGGDIGVSVAA